MNQQLRHPLPEVQNPEYPSPSPPSEEACRTDSRNVLVTYGIHHGRYPVGGMTVRDVRTMLSRLIQMDETAVPVIQGRPVSEDTVLQDNVRSLQFVKPSSLKGATATSEIVTLEGKQAHLLDGNGQKHVVEITDLAMGMAESTLHGLHAEPLPDNTRWVVDCGSVRVYVLELKPELRWIKWLAPDSPAPYGASATCKEYQLATPYVVIKAPFRKGQLIPRVEVFYRDKPLTALDGDGGELFWPNLLNVSPNAYHCVAWFCTQYLMAQGIPKGYTGTLDQILHHLWGGLFNRSSEAHEGDSTFGLCQKYGVDARVTDVERWQEESLKDPKFVLSVAWKPTGHSVRSIIQHELSQHRIEPVPGTAASIGNILLKKSKPK